MDKYIFISYAHKDEDRVLPVVQTMRENGFRVWYDEGIDPGTEWDKNIASHITGCSYFIAFISKAYLESSNCKDEINFARDLEKKRFLVYIEDVELPQEMKMRLSRIQNIFMHKYVDKNVFYQKLFAAEGIEVCRERSYAETAASKMPPSAPVQTATIPYLYKPKTSPWIIALVILLAIAIIGGGLLFFLSQKNNNASNVNPTPAPTPTESVQSTVPLTNTPTPEPTKEPTNTPASVDNTPTPEPTAEPEKTPTPEPTKEPTKTPTPQPTKAPTNTPTPKPTNTPTPIPHVHSFDSDYVCTSCGESGHTEGLEYKLNDAETYYIVTGIGSASGKEVIIPSEHKGLPVREIADNAFNGLSKLTKLVIPKTIKKIASGAFYNTRNLAEIEFNAISCEDCYPGIFEHSGQDGDGIYLTIGKDVTRIPAHLFHTNSSSYYAAITSVVFKGSSVTEIGEAAFMYCCKLKEITLPDGIKTIAKQSFSCCLAMQSLTIPSSVKKIGSSAFYETKNLTKIDFNAISCEDCYPGIFECSGQDGDGIYLTIGKDVTRIPAHLFHTNSSSYYAAITSVVFKGSSVTEIGEAAFMYCCKLTEITLPKGIRTISKQAFSNCTSLTSVFFEEPYTWYAGSTLVAEFGDPQTAATALTSTYVGSDLKKE